MLKLIPLALPLLVLAAGAMAQPKGISPEQINRSLPLEGAPLAIPGPYKTTSEPAFGSPDHVVYRPENLDAFPKKDTLPVMVWGNGGCAIDSTRYGGFLSTIASHGFVVISTVAQPGAQPAAPKGTQKGAPRRSATVDDQRAAIDWAVKENTRAESPLKGKLALDKIAVMGTSCGGFLALTLGGDPRVKTIGVFNSGIADASGGVNATQPGADVLPKLHGPVLLINGGEVDFMMGPSLSTFEKISNLPAFYGARDNAGHSATIFHPGGGEFANVASNWLLYIFKKDKKAAKMFVGEKCELCTNSNWDVQAKKIK
jgi:acetyl esterase/lipase